MEPSKVYFTDMRARPGTNLQQKLEKLMRRAGFETIDFKDKYAAIKIHFGEPGNLSYLRPGRQAVFDRLQHIVCGQAQECAGPYGRRL